MYTYLADRSNIYFPFVGSYIPLSTNKDYDLNPSKRKVQESKDEYNKRLLILNNSQKPTTKLKSFCKTIMTIILLVSILVVVVITL